MIVDPLIRLTQDFLDAEIMLEQRRCVSPEIDVESQRFDRARHQLQDHLDNTRRDDSEQSLAAHATEYLAAVDDFNKARTAKQDLNLPARLVERAQRKLQSMMYRAARQGACPGESHPKRLLVAIDSDGRASETVAAASELAEVLPATLKLIHVRTNLVTSQLGPLYYSDELDEAVRRKTGELLQSAKSEVPPDVQCEVLAREGDPAVEIVSAASRWGADYIVMGTRGFGRIGRFILGSTAEAVVGLAPCPVVTVGHHRSKRLLEEAADEDHTDVLAG